METTQRILLADIYSYCQRNKNQSRDRELREQQRLEDSQKEDESASEVESILQDVVELPDVEEVLQDDAQDGVLAVPQLIQLDSPPDVESELKTLVADYPPSAHFNTRFTITKITENEFTSSSSDDESSESCSPVKELESFSERTVSSLLVDLTSPPAAPSTQSQGLLAAMSSGDRPLIDFSPGPVPEKRSNLTQGNSDGLLDIKRLDCSHPLSSHNANSTGKERLLKY